MQSATQVPPRGLANLGRMLLRRLSAMSARWRVPTRCLAAAAAAATASVASASALMQSAPAELAEDEPDAFSEHVADARGAHAAGEVHVGRPRDIPVPERPAPLNGVRSDRQLIWETLSEGDRRIRRIGIWQWLEGEAPAEPGSSSPGQTRLRCVVELGDELNGHAGIVHGGFTAALLDDLFGWVCAHEKRARSLPGMILTANLHVDYKSPVLDSSAYVIDVRAERVEDRPQGRAGKQLLLSATVSDARGRVCARATSTYVVKMVGASFASRAQSVPAGTPA